jgi:hypothetical protein
MRRVGLILLLLCVATRLPAQWQATADAGTAHVRQAGIPESNAFTLAAGADVLGARAAMRSRLLGACGNNRCTGQAVLLASIVGPNATGPNWELSGALSAFGDGNQQVTKSGEGMARLRLGSTVAGGAIGIGTGALTNVGGTRALYHAQATAWRTLPSDQIVADLSFVGTSGVDVTQSFEARTQYGDVSASWRRQHGWLDIGATAGARAGFRAAASGGWGSIEAAAWLTPNLALVATAGRSLEDVPRGVPRTQYVGVALRLAARGNESLGRSHSVPSVPKTVVTRGGVVVQVDQASRVELMADFTEWSVVPLERVGNRWKLDRAVPSGFHRIAIRVDGGDWTSPPGLPRAIDDLGGAVGVITVP